MVGMEDEQHVQRTLEPRVGRVLELRHFVHHPEEVPGVAEVVVGIDVRLAHVVAERERGEGRHLREQPDDLHRADPLVVDAVGIGVEGGQAADRGDEHAHRVGVVAEALHEVLDVLVHERVNRDLLHPIGELALGGERAVDQQICDLQVGGVLAQLLDRVAAMLEDPGLPVDEGDRTATGGGVHVGRVIGHQAEVPLAGLDLP